MADGEICHIDLGEAFRRRYGNPYAVVHRGDLHGVLLKGCREHPLIELEVSSEVTGYDQDGNDRHRAARQRRDCHRRGADRRRRAVVERAPTGGGRRRAARVGPHDLPLGDPDRADARGSALERRHAVGRAEVPHRPLPAVGLEGVQPRRHLSQRCAGAGRRQAGVDGGGAGGLHPHLRPRPEHHQPRPRLAAVGAVRPRSGRPVARRPGGAAGRRRASDAAVHGAGRLHGDGGRGLPGRFAGEDRHAGIGPRDLPRRGACCAPRGCSSCRAPWATTSITRPARTRRCAMPS